MIHASAAEALPDSRAEQLRLDALVGYGVLDTPPEPEYDDIVFLASAICNTPIALVSLVDRDRQWFKAACGVSSSETPREHAFCARAIQTPDRITVVRDARADARFRDNPLVVGEPHIRFYAGAPLVNNDGFALGTLCVIDREPRDLDGAQRRALQALARQVIVQLELRRSVRELEQNARRLHRYQTDLEAAQRRLERTNARLLSQSVTDALTGLKNRRAFRDCLHEEFRRAQRSNVPLSLVLLDLDAFKAYNDSFGHLEGDEVMRRVARLLTESARSADLVARFGGEEFAIVLPDADADAARLIAERCRQRVQAARWENRAITLSAGIATQTATMDNAAQLIARADAALYGAKTGGRNRVVHVLELDR